MLKSFPGGWYRFFSNRMQKKIFTNIAYIFSPPHKIQVFIFQNQIGMPKRGNLICMYISSLGIRTKCTPISSSYLQSNSGLSFKIQVYAPQNIGWEAVSDMIRYEKYSTVWIVPMMQIHSLVTYVIVMGKIEG